MEAWGDLRAYLTPGRFSVAFATLFRFSDSGYHNRQVYQYCFVHKSVQWKAALQFQKISAEKRPARIEKTVKQFSEETIRLMKLTNENLREKLRLSSAIALVEQIEQQLIKHTSRFFEDDLLKSVLRMLYQPLSVL